MKGNQIPRIRIEPPRVDTDGKGAARLMSAYGLTLDPFQELVLDAWMGTDKWGNYTAVSCGISAPRQNGKNVILEALEFYNLVVNGARIIHTAHQVRTARSAFRRLVDMFSDKKHPEIIKTVKRTRFGNGDECIELNNGGRIEFLARSRQAARGYDGISLLVFDEAQELTDDQMESLMAVLSASSTGQRQQIFCGTPPYAGCPGDVFRRFRSACIEANERGEVTKNCWHEWSIAADSIADIDVTDKKLWYEANPALCPNGRLNEAFTEQESRILSADGFARERLGVWFKPASAENIEDEFLISAEVWDKCASDEEHPEGKTAYGVKFAPDGSEVVLAGAVIGSDGKARITLLAMEPTGRGLAWLATWLNARYNTASCVVIDGRNGTDVLVDKISGTWIFKNSIIRPNAQNITHAASLLLNELNEGTVTWYSKQEELRNSALTTTKRKIGIGWGFGGSTCIPIEACSLALWGARTSKRDPRKVMRIG